MATISAPDAARMWQNEYERMTGTTDSIVVLATKGAQTRVKTLVIDLDDQLMAITTFACTTLVIPVPATLVNGGGGGDVQLIDLPDYSVAPAGGPLAPNPLGLHAYIQNFPAAERPRVIKIFQSLLEASILKLCISCRKAAVGHVRAYAMDAMETSRSIVMDYTSQMLQADAQAGGDLQKILELQRLAKVAFGVGRFFQITVEG